MVVTPVGYLGVSLADLFEVGVDHTALAPKEILGRLGSLHIALRNRLSQSMKSSPDRSWIDIELSGYFHG